MRSPLHTDFHRCSVIILLHYWVAHLNCYSSPHSNILVRSLADLILKKLVFTPNIASDSNSNLDSNSRMNLKNPCLRPNPSTLPPLIGDNCSKMWTLRTLLDTVVLHSNSKVKPNCNQSRPFGQMELVYMIFLDRHSLALHLNSEDDLPLRDDDSQNSQKLVWKGPCKRLVALLDLFVLDYFQILPPRFDLFAASILTNFEMCRRRQRFHYLQTSVSEIQISPATDQLVSLEVPFAIHSPNYSSIFFLYLLRSQKMMLYLLSLVVVRNFKRWFPVHSPKDSRSRFCL